MNLFNSPTATGKCRALTEQVRERWLGHGDEWLQLERAELIKPTEKPILNQPQDLLLNILDDRNEKLKEIVNLCHNPNTETYYSYINQTLPHNCTDSGTFSSKKSEKVVFNLSRITTIYSI